MSEINTLQKVNTRIIGLLKMGMKRQADGSYSYGVLVITADVLDGTDPDDWERVEDLYRGLIEQSRVDESMKDERIAEAAAKTPPNQSPEQHDYDAFSSHLRSFAGLPLKPKMQTADGRTLFNRFTSDLHDLVNGYAVVAENQLKPREEERRANA